MSADFPDVKYQVAPLPEGPEGQATLSFTNCWGIAAKSKNQAAAVDLVKYLTSTDQQLAFAKAFGVMPSVQSAAGQFAAQFPEQKAFVEGAGYATGPTSLPGFDQVHHLVLFPTYGESDEILADTLHYVSRQDFPLDRVSVVLAFEERDAQAPARAERLVARFGSLFENLLITFHPELPGEVKGKSSNLTWAARRVQEELIDTDKVDPEHLIVTVCDADSRLHRGYLSALSHDVLTHPNGRLHIFQPAILFYANHWRLIAPLRAMNSIYSLWELARMVPSHRLVTQSTYSLSWSAVH